MEVDDLEEELGQDDWDDTEQTKLLKNFAEDREKIDGTSNRGENLQNGSSFAHSSDFLVSSQNDEACSSLTVDQFLERIGSFSWYQIFLVLVLGIPSFFGCFQFLESSFTMADTPWQCVKSSQLCLLNGTIEPGDDNYDYRCKIPRNHWEFVHVIGSNTAVMEWELVCDRAILATLAKSLILIGCFFGNVAFGMIADKFGRKNPALIATLVCNIIAFAGSFSPSYPLFAVAKVLAGFGVGAGVSLFVLAMECCGVKHRATAGIINGMIWPVGLILLALLAYIFTEWRMLCRVLTAPLVILFIPLFWIVPESMRWNALNGRVSEAEKTLKRIAKYNRKEMPQVPLNIPPRREVKSQSGNIIDLLRNWTMARQTIVVWFGFFANGLVYYGVAMSSGSLGANKYLSFLISSAIEIPSHLLAIWLLNRIGRKFSLVSGLLCASIFAGTCVLAFPLSHNESEGTKAGRVITAVLAKLAIVVSFISVYIFSAEIFPTTLRTTGVNTGSAAARIGAISAPYVLYLGRIHNALPYSILGITGLLAGLMCLSLKETRLTPTKELLKNKFQDEGSQDIELCENRTSSLLKDKFQDEDSQDIELCENRTSSLLKDKFQDEDSQDIELCENRTSTLY